MWLRTQRALVLLGVVTGEEPAFRVAVIGVIVGLVLGIEVAPVAGNMAIEQADDHSFRDRCCDGGGGKDPAKGVAQGGGG